MQALSNHLSEALGLGPSAVKKAFEPGQECPSGQKFDHLILDLRLIWKMLAQAQELKLLFRGAGQHHQEMMVLVVQASARFLVMVVSLTVAAAYQSLYCSSSHHYASSSSAYQLSQPDYPSYQISFQISDRTDDSQLCQCGE